MPWFKIDDSAHSHPKFMRAGNAALGLWLRCGSYSAQHLLEGFVPKDIVKPFKGTPAQVQKLVDAGLWHDAGHDCKRCPQPTDGYMIHDFFEGGRNTTRAQHEANKKSAAERAAKSRETRKRTGSASNPNNIQDAIGSEIDTDPVQNQTAFSGSTAGQGDLSHRTPADGATPAQASPVLPSPSEKEKEDVSKTEGQPSGASLAHIGDRPRIPANCEPLVVALQAAQLFVGWDLRPDEWFLIEALIARCGLPALVTSARGSWQGARVQPRSARYFLPAWRKLPDAAAPGTPDLAPVHQLTGTDAKAAGWLALGAKYATDL
jgi:hypothetical protein